MFKEDNPQGDFGNRGVAAYGPEQKEGGDGTHWQRPRP